MPAEEPRGSGMSGRNWVSTGEVRSTFLDYFQKHDHAFVPSAPLIPHNDPTLMFVNAGMVPFKNVFTGAETRDYSRATSCQKCVRAGGKHNDLDNVGYTARHHTFFEMLGNFSFGDYGKAEAIEFAWELITKVYELPADRLWVSVYPEDDEARTLWRKISSIPGERIVDIEDNLWAMGETGPCGFNSEIFFDHGDHIPGGPPGSPDEDLDRFVEIWNLVFMQFNQVTPDERVPLEKLGIDTGLGLERVAAILQGTHDNFDTDTFRTLIDASVEVMGVDEAGENGFSHRIIADHIRSAAFLIADGILPSNEGRGYVLRRILRRAMRHAHILGAKEPVMWRLVPALNDTMSGHYPELSRAEALVTETLKLEETRFQQTLETGLRILETEIAKLKGGAALPGDVAFRLYDTYGFPVDLTEDILRGQGRGVDTDGFDLAMDRQRAEARAAWAGSGEAATEEVWFDIRDRVGPTEFLGYGTDQVEGAIVAMLIDGSPVEAIRSGDKASILTNQTPFYAEAGGQVGDTGNLTSAGGAAFEVEDTVKRLDNLHVHTGTLMTGELKIGDVLDQTVDSERRDQTRANHSATHLLHAALRRHLGDHVTQKGSLVSPERLRFDFSHPRPIEAAKLSEIESEVNEYIRQNSEVATRLMTPDEAVADGAMALFGEKYGDEVRVLTMGEVDGGPYSVELCGGTHVTRTGDIGLMKIIAETGIAAGVRRIEGLTGFGAMNYLNSQLGILRQSAGLLKVGASDVPDRIAALVDERKRLETELSDTRRKLAIGENEGSKSEEIGGVRFIGQCLENVPAKELRAMIDDLKAGGAGIYALIAVNDGKASVAIGVTGDVIDQIDAVALIKTAVSSLGGKGGGGRPDMAQGGGPEGDQADAALNAIRDAVTAAL